MTMETTDSILDFWFGSSVDDALVAKEKSALWWAKDGATDQLMRERFASFLPLAAAGALDDWLGKPRGRLALILLCDQFSRNIHRGTPQSFAFDEQARAWCKAGLQAGDDRRLRPIERVFFYLPLEHAESLDEQHEAVARYADLCDALPPAQREDFAGYLDFARQHRTIIERFGRFPHRNAILGRASTAEEILFLQGPGSSF
ncbi:DUF924 family protein [Uliginosibacterium sp. H3]|uniref:DUF924 family protein n=1 Tax=Uliginosibacterium silvisoli TaxID=3114758 RepID=A0ABU6K2C2_9RHOO|nr:DUF924 family protein [Uliginosibacterium sp. H3]